MESSGVYWHPLYNVWHTMGVEVTVGSASHMKNVLGTEHHFGAVSNFILFRIKEELQEIDMIAK